ncbi:MAG: imelysin family protein [Burkholderiaceae bacterium]|nr:imelysin family protein [Burkholderiaceae bacterium]
MMRGSLSLLLACGIAAGVMLAGCERGPKGPTPESIAAAEQKVIDRLYAAHIVPGITAFAAGAEELATAAGAFCEARDAGNFERLQQAWRDTVLAWQPLRWLQTGPGSDQHRMLRIDAWPQARLDLVATRVGQLLASNQSVDVGAIADQPVQLQGLPALETLLFEDRGPTDFPSDAAGDRRCALVAGIAGNLAGIARTQERLWQRGVAGGTAANSIFVSAGGAAVAPHNVINQIGNLLMQQLVELKDAAIGAPLGISPSGQAFSPRPRLAHSWRSRASLERVVASLESVQAVYSGGKAGDDGMDDLLALRGAAAAATEFETLLAAALEQARTLRDDGATIYDGAADGAFRERFLELRNRVRDLEIHAQLVMMPALEVALTFNFADGD